MNLRSKYAAITAGLTLAVGLVGLAVASNLSAKSDNSPKAGASAPAYAGSGKAYKAQGHCMGMKGWFSEALGLTDTQKAQIQEIKARAKASMQNLSKEERKARWTEVRAEMEAVLTPEQRAKLAEMKAQCAAKKAAKTTS